MKNTLLALFLFSSAGCGDEAAKSSSQASPIASASASVAPADPPTASAPAAGFGVVAGTVRIKGEVKKPPKVPVTPECLLLHKGEAPRSEQVVTNGEKRVKWAVVYVKSGLEGRVFVPPSEPVVLDQQGCIYKPHVFGVMVGQPLRVRNSDPHNHNIHGLPFDNKEFNFVQLPNQESTVVFTRPETPISVKCDIHGWMKTWGHVFPHPFFAVTDDAGAFALKGLPTGKYTIAVWQEAYKLVTQELTLQAGETKTVDFELAEKKE